jgi:hypothetical protein
VNQRPTNVKPSTDVDAETRALNQSPEFQAIMAEGDRAIKGVAWSALKQWN